MVAGLNLRFDIVQTNYSNDDDVGGALITGSTSYYNVSGMMSMRRPSQASLEAGLEVEQIFDVTIVGRSGFANVIVRERDELQVTAPVGHPYYGERFRVTGVQLDSRRRPYGHISMTANRIERSRRRQ